jgi:hypothetical protein
MASMHWGRAAFSVAAAVVALLLAACGSRSTTPSAKVSTQTTTASTTAAPATDTLSVSVATTGVGAWQLVAIPVAVLHNNATHHGAAAVVVHFVTHAPGGGTLGSLDSEAVNLAPNETLPVAADCTDGCNGAASTDVTVTVGSWTTSSGPSFTTAPGAYKCGTGACGGGPGQGSVSGPITVSRLAADSSIVVFAVCTDSGGAVVGAGVTQTVWSGGTSAPVNVPVIVNSDPAACQLGASAGW